MQIHTQVLDFAVIAASSGIYLFGLAALVKNIGDIWTDHRWAIIERLRSKLGKDKK